MAHYWLPDATSGTGTGNWSATGATGHWADDEGEMAEFISIGSGVWLVHTTGSWTWAQP